MSTLYIVRHGQARLFTDDYDRLSDLGLQQAERLAERWIDSGVRPRQVWAGTMLRQQQTAATIGERFAMQGIEWPEVRISGGLDEFPAEQLVESIAPALQGSDTRIAETLTALSAAVRYDDRYRYLHRLLEAVIGRWIHGDYGDVTVPVTWTAFASGVRESLRQIMAATGPGECAVAFTSGGPVGVSVQTVLQAPDIKAAELNWRLHNCSVTRYTFSGDRVSLDAFNDVSHLPAALLTYR